MPSRSSPVWLNHLLGSVTDPDCNRICEAASRITCQQLDVLQGSNDNIRYVYFPETASVSVMMYFKNGRSAEVGVIGREGVLGLEVWFGKAVASFEWVVQGPGTLLRVSVGDFLALLRASPPFKEALATFALDFQDQIAETAASNASHTLDQRLARRLLISRDRSNHDAMPLTQELLATMLGVRRAGVSVAASQLRASGCIDYTRGSVTITDRGKLEIAADGSYQASRRAAEGQSG